jgi:hypothetical protein
VMSWKTMVTPSTSAAGGSGLDHACTEILAVGAGQAAVPALGAVQAGQAGGAHVACKQVADRTRRDRRPANPSAQDSRPAPCRPRASAGRHADQRKRVGYKIRSGGHTIPGQHSWQMINHISLRH